MRPDLLHAIASIDWAESNLPAFALKINAWLADNVYADTIDIPGNTTDQLVVAVEKELLPLSFIVEAGAYINAIRSGLDILAVSLAIRFSIPRAFPVEVESGDSQRSVDERVWRP